jgi:hypothetical protein
MHFDSTLQTARRATVGKSALGWTALLCLILNAAFWAALMLDLLAPPSPLSPQAIQAALGTVAFALILPLFWSMLLPSSPAGRLLQKQTWATPGYAATTGAAVFLTYLAGTWLRAWWSAQPNVTDANADMLLTISSLIAGVLVPALSWCVTTPEQWIAQIEQARHVKLLEHTMKMEEATMRAAYARGVALLNAGLSDLTIEQRKELAGILGGFARTQQQAMQQIAASWKEMYGVECQLATIPDQQLLESYQQVAGLLTEGGDALGTSARYALTVSSSPAQQDAQWDAPRDGETLPMRRRDDTPSVPAGTHGTLHEEAYHKARGVLNGAWKRTDLEHALSVSRSQAHRYLTDWQDARMVKSVDAPRDHYTWGS